MALVLLALKYKDDRFAKAGEWLSAGFLLLLALSPLAMLV